MLIGLVLLLLTYFFIGPDFLRKWSWLGFVLSFLLLLILDMEGIGPIKAPKINGAVRFLSIGGKQLHVFEVVKVAMVMYAAWGVDKLKNGQCKLLDKLSELKNMAWLKNGFVRRMILLYLPLGIIFVMVMKGSNSAAVFIAGILLVTMVVGTGEWKEALLIVAALAALVLIMFGINRIAAKAGMENPPFGRINTAISRLTPHNYEKEYLLATDAETRKNAKDKLHQPYSARIAIHQGRGLGKGPGQSTQRYVVPDMSEDYMFSFIVEEYGILGGLIVMILYISLVARGVLIVKSCGNNLFAQCAVFGLVLYLYALEYSDRNRERFSAFDDWKALQAYLKQQPLLEEFTEFAATKGIKKRPTLIQISGKLIVNQLQAYIVRNFFDDAGFYPIFLQDDITLLKAVQLLKEGKSVPSLESQNGKTDGNLQSQAGLTKRYGRQKERIYSDGVA